MKKLIIVALILSMSVIMGVKGCSPEDQLLATQVALATVQTGMTWADATIQNKCTAGTWKPEDCAQWATQSPLVKDVLQNVIPWVIKKLAETTTPEEKAELSKALEGK